MDEVDRRFAAYTKEDNRRLQVLENKVLRMQTRLPRDTPTATLVKAAGEFSVQQLIAYHTLMTVFSVITSGKPKYLADKMKLSKPNNNIFPQRQANTIIITPTNLSIARGGFIQRGASLFNSLPVTLRSEKKTSSFRRGIKKWITESINIKPP